MRAIKLAASLVLCTGVTSERPNMESVAAVVCAAAAPIIRLSISDIARWRSRARSASQRWALKWFQKSITRTKLQECGRNSSFPRWPNFFPIWRIWVLCVVRSDTRPTPATPSAVFGGRSARTIAVSDERGADECKSGVEGREGGMGRGRKVDGRVDCSASARLACGETG